MLSRNLFVSYILPIWICLAALVVPASIMDFSTAEAATTVTDGLGRRVTVEKLPKRIVSTTPTNTETLYDLGLKDRVIAVTSHCATTIEAEGKAVIGGWSDKTIAEKIAPLKPDLVVSFGGLQTPLAAEMEKRDIPTFVFCPETVDQALEQILSIGELTGTSEEARGIVARCRGNLKRIKDTYCDIQPERRPKCLRLMSTQAMVIGGRSFQSDMIKCAGGVNVFENIDEAYPVVSLEDVKAKDPDIIIFNRDNEKEAIDSFLKQDGWKDLRAAKEGRLFSISCDYICHPNTRIDKTVDMLARRFYPDLFAVDRQNSGKYPARIISLAPSVTEQLYLLGAGDRMVGVTNYCVRPDEARLVEKVGNITEANAERIIELKPDLVIATTLVNPKIVESLKQLGIDVKIVPQPNSFSELCRQFIELGRSVGREDEALDIVNGQRTRIKEIEERIATLPKTKVFVQVGAKPLVTAGNCAFINNMIELAGGVNIAEGLDRITYAPYSRENVLRADPDCIIIVTMGITAEEEKKTWRSFTNLKAVKNGNIYVVDAYRCCSPTPVTFSDMLQEIATILHPQDAADTRAGA